MANRAITAGVSADPVPSTKKEGQAPELGLCGQEGQATMANGERGRHARLIRRAGGQRLAQECTG